MAPRVGTTRPKAKSKANLTVVDGGGAAEAAPKKPAPIGHNQSPEEKQRAKDAAEQAQLMSYLSKLGEQDRAVAKAKAVLDEARGEMTETFRLAKAAGFERQELSALMKDMKTSTKDLVAAELRRRKLRVMAGLPTGEEQMKLFAGDAPQEAKDEIYWRAEGYQAYWRGEECSPPRDRMPARFDQVWMQGWNEGQTASALSMQMVAEQAEAAREAEPDPSKPAGYKVEKTAEGWITLDCRNEDAEEHFGSTHKTEAEAWGACRADAETVARQEAKAAEEKAKAAEAEAEAEEIEEEAV